MEVESAEVVSVRSIKEVAMTGVDTMRDGLVKFLMDKGVVFVCAMCNHMHGAVSRGGSNCGKQDCGGPFGGKAYPDYDGVLATSLAGWCFLCGAKPDASVQVPGGGTVGVCEEHVHDVSRFTRKGVAPPLVVEVGASVH